MENLLNEKAPETILRLELYYFKDIDKDRADELYQEVYDFIDHFKQKGFGRINLEVIVFPEYLLTSAQIDKETFDG